MTTDLDPNFNPRDDQMVAWLRRILDEQMRQTQQLQRIARAAQLYFWLTVIGLILGICGPLAVLVLGLTTCRSQASKIITTGSRRSLPIPISTMLRPRWPDSAGAWPSFRHLPG
jgi:hypothetical protein